MFNVYIRLHSGLIYFERNIVKIEKSELGIDLFINNTDSIYFLCSSIERIFINNQS